MTKCRLGTGIRIFVSIAFASTLAACEPKYTHTTEIPEGLLGCYGVRGLDEEILRINGQRQITVRDRTYRIYVRHFQDDYSISTKENLGFDLTSAKVRENHGTPYKMVLSERWLQIKVIDREAEFVRLQRIACRRDIGT